MSIEYSRGLTEDGKTVGIYTTPIFGKAVYCHLFFRPKRASSSSSPGPSAWEQAHPGVSEGLKGRQFLFLDIAHQTVSHRTGILPSVFRQLGSPQEFKIGKCGVGD